VGCRVSGGNKSRDKESEVHGAAFRAV
jgi:hypothetical protein